MRTERFSFSGFSFFLNGLFLVLLAGGLAACGGGSDKPERTGSSSGGGVDGGPTAAAEQRTDVSSTPSDTGGTQAKGPTPIDDTDSLNFEEVETSDSTSETEEESVDDEDSGQDDVGTTSDSPLEPEPEQSTLEFATDPAQATVTIENQETGTRKTKATPATFEVPPGLYSWTVKKEGYATKASRQAVDLETQREETQSVDLVSVSGDGSYLRRANQAYQQGNYQQAISLYQSVPEPSAEAAPTDYLRAQGRLGRIYWKQEENYEAAIQAYQNIIGKEDTRYEAFLNLAQIHLETGNYSEVLKRLDRVNELKYRIPTQDQKRLRISLQTRYLRGRALYQQAQDEETPNRRAKALRANQAFRGFLSSVPPDLESTFSRQVEDARQKQEEVRTLLREELR